MSRRGHRSGNYFVFPSEFDWLLHSTGTTTRRAARLLGRTARTVHDWRSGRRPVPKWAFQLVYYAALDLPELVLERARHRPWVDLRRYFAAPANAEHFLQAGPPRQATDGAPGHAAPQPGEAGSAGSACEASAKPGRGHGPGAQVPA